MGALRNFELFPILSEYKPQIAIELGSGYGTGIYELLQFPFNAILSVEINKEQVDLLNKFFRFDTRIKVYNGLTVDFLRQILPQIPLNIPLFIFSDAHFPNADFGLAEFDAEQNESIRMPLIEELKLIKDLRADNGAKDVILIDDISLYDDIGQYEDDHKKKDCAAKLLPRIHRNYLPKIIENFKNTHNERVFGREQGYLALLPKKS